VALPAVKLVGGLLSSASLLWKITIIDSWLLVYRGVQKFISVQSIYNFKQAAFATPRVVVGNLINFLATVRALKMYLANKLFRTPIVWLKTAHVFPGEAELSEYIKTIEDLLIEEGLATHEQILHALQVEKAGSAPLCLLRMGLLDEKDFTQIWSKHSRLEARFINPAEIPAAPLRRFREADSLKLEAIPIEQKDDQLVMAFREPPGSELVARLNQQLGLRVQPVLSRPSNISYARDCAYPRLVLSPPRLAAFSARFQQAAGLDGVCRICSSTWASSASRKRAKSGPRAWDVRL